MANNFFNTSGNPVTNSQGLSATMRAEFEAIEDGFDKLPTITGNALKAIIVNSSGTALEVVSVTGTGSVVKATSPTISSPTITTPTINGATNINGNVTINDGSFVFNDSGLDKDLRVEGTSDQNLVFVDASTNRVGIGTSSPTEKFSVNGVIKSESGGFVFPDGTSQVTASSSGSVASALYLFQNFGGF